MALDNATNFAKVTVSTTYDDDDTSIVLTGGHGALLPSVPFNAVWWNSTDYSDPSDDPNKEIVRVTAISTDTLTVTRGQESITATTKNTGGKTYKMIAGLTALGANLIVTGPTSATDNTIARYDGTDGNTVQTTGITIDDTNNITFPSEGTPVTYTIKPTDQATSNKAGNAVNLLSGIGNGTAAGGTLFMAAGTGGSTGNGGTTLIRGGTAGASGNGAGGAITLNSGLGKGTGAGGTITIETMNGGATSGAGGGINILAGSSVGASGVGGSIDLQAGYSANGTAGAIILDGGLAADNGTGGQIQIEGGHGLTANNANGGQTYIAGGDAGQNGNGNGGDVVLRGGLKNGSGTDGIIKFYKNSGSTVGVFLNLTSIATSSKTLTLSNSTGLVEVTSVFALTDGATPALDASLGSMFTLDAAGNRTIAVPSNPTSGQKITIRHYANGAARTLALNTGAGGFRYGSDITGLTETASGKKDYIGAIYNSTDSFWDVVSYVKGF